MNPRPRSKTKRIGGDPGSRIGAVSGSLPTLAAQKTAAFQSDPLCDPRRRRRSSGAGGPSEGPDGADGHLRPGPRQAVDRRSGGGQQRLERFAANLKKSHKLEKVSDTKFTLLVGEDHWPSPIPIVKDGNQWRFDTAAGLEEILNRHIGEDELSAIMTCRAYVLAQWEYYTQANGTAQDGLAVYAQKFTSTPGKHDGLYWETPPGAKPSPLGSLVAQARAEGYAAGQPRPKGTPKRPYHGYYFKILHARVRTRPAEGLAM
jgi:hypothetical protein